MSVSVNVPLQEIKDYFDGVEGLVQRVYANRRYQIAETFVDVVTPFVPVKSGNLRASATILDDGRAVEWSAVNPRTGYNYAALQYEVPMDHPRGGTDHWDQEAMWYEGDTFMDRVENILKK